MADNLRKLPSKGILKNSSSFDIQEHRLQQQQQQQQQQLDRQPRKSIKETTWDEMNILATLHPPDKDYGHMKIDEPKTPFNYAEDQIDGVDAEQLKERIESGQDSLPKVLRESTSSIDSDEGDDDADLTPEEREKKREFESRRKHHYNEYYAVKMARKLLEEDDEEDEGNDKKQQTN